MAELTGVVAYCGARQPDAGQGDDARQSPGSRDLQATAGTFAYPHDATITPTGGTPATIRAGEVAYVWQGSVAATEAAKIAAADFVSHRWYVFWAPSATLGRLFLCRAQDWQTVAGSIDALKVEYQTRGGWRRGQIKFRPCLPFTGTPDPYVVQVADMAGEVGPIHVGADGNLYAAVPATLPKLTSYLSIVRVATDLSGGTTPFLDTTAQAIPFYRLINFGGDFATPNMHTDFAISATKVYVSDATSRVWSYNLDGTGATVVAGTGVIGFNGDGVATACKLHFPTGLALAPDGLSLLICDMGNGMVRRLTFADGQLTRVAGGHKAGHPDQTDFSVGGDISSNTGDGGLATADGIWISAPSSVVQAPNGDLYIGLATLTHIKKVDVATGILSTYSPGGFVTESFTEETDTSEIPNDIGFACPEPGSIGDRYSVALDPLGNVYNWTCGVLSRSNVQVTDIAPHTAGRSSGFGTHISTAGRITIPLFLLWGADGLLYSTRETTIVRWQCTPA